MAKSLSFFIGKRYASLRSRNLLVGFISNLSVLGLSLGVAILITFLSIANGFERELETRILALVPHLTVTNFRNESLMTESQWQINQQKIDQLEGIKASSLHMQLQGLLLANGRSKGIILSAIEPIQESKASIIEDFVTQGSYDSLQEGEFVILIGEGLAELLKVQVGDSVSLASTVVSMTPLGEFPRQKTFTVGGIFKVGSALDNNVAYVHLSVAQRLYRIRDKVQGLRVQLTDVFDLQNSIDNIQTALAPGQFRFNNWTTEYADMYENIRFSKTLVGLLLSLLVAVAAFNVVVSLIMIVKDKEGDIAILRTMGASLSSIRNIFLVQGFIIGLIGTGFGVVLGVILSLTISDIFNGLEDLLNLELLPEDIYPVNYLPSHIEISDIVLVAIVSMALSLLATLYPAYTAAKVNPSETLRYE